MAGTIVADTIQDGAGNSTAMDNAIYGSAKAWVNFNGASSPTIRASYNVSSITRNAGGDWTVNMTNALTDANYSYCVNFSPVYGAYWSAGVSINAAGTSLTEQAPTTTSFRFLTYFITNGNGQDSKYVNVIVLR